MLVKFRYLATSFVQKVANIDVTRHMYFTEMTTLDLKTPFSYFIHNFTKSGILIHNKLEIIKWEEHW